MLTTLHPLSAKVGTNFIDELYSLGQYSFLADSGYGVVVFLGGVWRALLITAFSKNQCVPTILLKLKTVDRDGSRISMLELEADVHSLINDVFTVQLKSAHSENIWKMYRFDGECPCLGDHTSQWVK
jgi:hypothetical protein